MAHVNLDHVIQVIVQRCTLSHKPNGFSGYDIFCRWHIYAAVCVSCHDSDHWGARWQLPRLHLRLCPDMLDPYTIGFQPSDHRVHYHASWYW